MFAETTSLGGLNLQLCYFRGQGEFVAGDWLSNTTQLAKRMSSVTYRPAARNWNRPCGMRREAASAKVSALVFVGDANGRKNQSYLCRC
ncbi:MAG TPA: hypothetical protein VKB53_06475 [Gammaproteobacteria bacterium]|nr:hypothetical protein [Gammaproteobacteria bacterium]